MQLDLDQQGFILGISEIKVKHLSAFTACADQFCLLQVHLLAYMATAGAIAGMQ